MMYLNALNLSNVWKLLVYINASQKICGKEQMCVFLIWQTGISEKYKNHASDVMTMSNCC